MSTASALWRRVALGLVTHASWVLPGARSDWAEAMRREIEYIEDDAAALRWAAGCVTASYGARLADLAQPRWRVAPGPVVAGSALLLMAMALQGHASDEATPPAREEPGCERPAMLPQVQPQPGRDRGGLHRQDLTGANPCSHEGREDGRWNKNP